MIAADLAVALDPVLLARQVGLEADAWQTDALRSAAPRALWNCSRQSGKSTIAALLAVHGAVYEPATLQLLLSPSERQSGELFKKAAGFYHALGRPVPATSETALTLTLANGSRIVSLPAQEHTIRGYSGVRRLIVDEASRVPDALYYAVRPMLAVSGGRLILMSTPWGKRGFFFREWTASGPTWRRFRVPATDCPRISACFLDEERESMPLTHFEQEYGCEFGEAEGAVFTYEQIQAALDPEVTPLWS